MKGVMVTDPGHLSPSCLLGPNDIIADIQREGTKLGNRGAGISPRSPHRLSSHPNHSPVSEATGTVSPQSQVPAKNS